MFSAIRSHLIPGLIRPGAQACNFVQGIRQFNTKTSPLFFKSTQMLWAEPMKKKRRIDPGIIRMREDRKKRRIEKQIRKLEKTEKQFKPIDEMEVPRKIIQELNVRSRKLPTLSQEVIDQRITLKREWSDYKRHQLQAELKVYKRLIKSQSIALEQLKIESPELYQEAIQFDLQLIPYTTEGPTETPAIGHYDCSDGCFNDITKKWT